MKRSTCHPFLCFSLESVAGALADRWPVSLNSVPWLSTSRLDSFWRELSWQGSECCMEPDLLWYEYVGRTRAGYWSEHIKSHLLLIHHWLLGLAIIYNVYSYHALTSALSGQNTNRRLKMLSLMLSGFCGCGNMNGKSVHCILPRFPAANGIPLHSLQWTSFFRFLNRQVFYFGFSPRKQCDTTHLC